MISAETLDYEAISFSAMPLRRVLTGQYMVEMIANQMTALCQTPLDNNCLIQCCHILHNKKQLSSNQHLIQHPRLIGSCLDHVSPPPQHCLNGSCPEGCYLNSMLPPPPRSINTSFLLLQPDLLSNSQSTLNGIKQPQNTTKTSILHGAMAITTA